MVQLPPRACQSVQNACFYRTLSRGYHYQRTVGQNRQTTARRKEAGTARGRCGGDRSMLQCGTELCISERKFQNTPPLLNGLVHAISKTKKIAVRLLFSHLILQQVFQTVYLTVCSRSHARNKTRAFRQSPTHFPCISPASEAAKLSHMLYFFPPLRCSHRSHLNWYSYVVDVIPIMVKR
jgi:hypothetical protein